MPESDQLSRTLPRGLQARYRIGEVLGVGGMSTVYAAHDPLLNRDVAVKVFTARATQQGDLVVQQAEAQLVASLNHHALTTLFDAGVDTSEPDLPQIYLVMEQIPGTDLRRRLEHGPLEPAQVCWLGFDLAEALAYVHESGFTHNDIKPANVLLADRGAETRMRGKLTDFGIASIVGAQTHSEFTTGTAAYLAPEQVEGGDATPSSDVYSLGLVLLEAATGRVAYPGGIEESAFARLDRQPDVPDRLPAPMGRLLREMTARRPADRPPLASIAARFNGILIDEVVARRVPPSETQELRQTLLEHQALDVVHAPADDAFDTVTRLATRMLGVPVAVVMMVDDGRVRVTSSHGLDLDEVGRSSVLSFTADPVQGAAWTIADTVVDARTRADPLILSAPHLRAFAAAPLIARDGRRLGALCVFDPAPRRFEPAELQDLTDLASTIVRELELRSASRRALFAHD